MKHSLGARWRALLIVAVLTLSACSERSDPKETVERQPARDGQRAAAVARGKIEVDGGLVALAPALAGTVDMFGSTIPVYRLFVIGFGALVSGGLFLLIEKSTFGMLVRAASSDGEMVRLLGLPVASVRMAVFALGSGLAGLAGAIAAPLFPIELGMATNTIIDCFIVVILGGLGNIRGAVAASLLIGLVRAIGYSYMPSWVDILTFSLLIATLLTRPQGLFFRATRSA